MELPKIKVKRNTNGDSRVAMKKPSFEEFRDANEWHKVDVKHLMSNVATVIEIAGQRHDWTKVTRPYDEMFYRNMIDTMDGKIEFEDGEWAKLHYTTERHHLRRNVPDDVNLIDVIEMVADCVCAGMARAGKVDPNDEYYQVPTELLQTALNNTVKLFADSIDITL